jgi:23S rRNA (uracil1939-C5)-methyltransferase
MASPPYFIEKLINGGFGLSRDKDGQIILIEGGIPGETVESRIKTAAKNVKKGAVTKVLHPSPERIQAPCPHYEHCGGCDFQHMAYPFQLQAKKEITKDLLKRSGHPLLQEAADAILEDPLASPQQFHYRQRIRLQVDDNLVVGFHKRRSHDCIAIESCLLARGEINDCLQELVSERSFQKLLFQTNSLEILLDPHSSHTTILLHFKRKPRPADETCARELTQSVTNLQNLFFMGTGFAATGWNSLSFTLPPIPPVTDTPLALSWETGGFFQVNLEQNVRLVRTVLDFCQVKKEDTILDLFCGMGNFSIPLAETAKSVLGIEGQGSAIRSAKKNSKAAGQSNTSFLKRPIHQACETLYQENRIFDCIVIDPPRQGAPGLAGKLASLCRERLIYISCDPATLCRDLANLLDRGFILTKLQPIDMFPQTHHIETVALLQKS